MDPAAQRVHSFLFFALRLVPRPKPFYKHLVSVDLLTESETLVRIILQFI